MEKRALRRTGQASLRVVREAPGSAPAVPVVAVIIPAFNEQDNLERVLTDVSRVARKTTRFRLVPIVVNDGSSDRTREILEELAPRFGAVVLHLPVNLGIGKAVQAGFRYAVQNLSPSVLLQLDGDGQHPAEEIEKIIDPILNGVAAVVVGSRYVPGAGGNVSSGFRRVGTAFFSLLLRAVVGVKIQDTTSGFRAFNRSAGEFLSRYYPDDYPEVQAYVPLARKGFGILEVPVLMLPRRGGKSSITPVGSFYYMMKVAFATLIDRMRRLPR